MLLDYIALALWGSSCVGPKRYLTMEHKIEDMLEERAIYLPTSDVLFSHTDLLRLPQDLPIPPLLAYIIYGVS